MGAYPGPWGGVRSYYRSWGTAIRQILVGKNFFRKEFGYEREFLWLPDVFGYFTTQI